MRNVNVNSFFAFFFDLEAETISSHHLGDYEYNAPFSNKYLLLFTSQTHMDNYFLKNYLYIIFQYVAFSGTSFHSLLLSIAKERTVGHKWWPPVHIVDL